MKKLSEMIIDGSVFQQTSLKIKRSDKQHSFESLSHFSGLFAIKLWVSPSIDISKVLLNINGEEYSDFFIAATAYPRDDASRVINKTAIGVTIFLASETIYLSNQKIDFLDLIIFEKNNDVFATRIPCANVNFHEFYEGINFDLSRKKDNLEGLFITGRDGNVLQFIQGLWSIHLNKIKNKVEIIEANGSNRNPLIRNSIISIFYKNTDLANNFLNLINAKNLSAASELILCFQEADLFRSQIEKNIYILDKIGIKYKILMFEENVGFSAANNMASDNAVGENLLFINPDLVVESNTVLEDICSEITSKKILGATLMSGGGDVMHNGISLDKQLIFVAKKPVTVIRTSHVGRHSRLKASKRSPKTIPVIAASGAVLGIKKSSFVELGRLSEEYVFAHFEDIDLCLAARRIGILTYVYQTNSIIHLESFSSGSESRLSTLKIINSSIFNRKFKGQL